MDLGKRREVTIPVKIPLAVYRMLVAVAEAHEVQVHQLGTAALIKVAQRHGDPAHAGAVPMTTRTGKARGKVRAPKPYVFKPKPETLAKADEVRRLHAEGFSPVQIGAKVQLRDETIRSLLDYLGIPRSHKPGRRPGGKREVAA